MRLLFILLIILFISCRVSLQTSEQKQKTLRSITSFEKSLSAESDTFQLNYFYVGLGSGFGSMQPMFRVKGTHYVYTMEQNSSFNSDKRKSPEQVCEGELSTSSIDSIMNLVSNIKDTLIYQTNPYIMSGGVHSLSVKKNKTNITFRLHNASDPIAEKIISIINKYIPSDRPKLWLFELPQKN